MKPNSTGDMTATETFAAYRKEAEAQKSSCPAYGYCPHPYRGPIWTGNSTITFESTS